MKRITFVFGSIFLILITCFTGIAGGFIGTRLGWTSSSNSTLPNITTEDVRVVNEESAVIDVAKNASLSVVSVVVTQELSRYYNDTYRRFFGEELDETREVGAGTGFVINEEGIIVTNRHVVDLEDASYTVVFNDGKEVEAKVLARDTILDIAFLKVENTDVTPLNLGTSSELEVGQSVIAIGNALGEFSNTVSTGIISGLSRDIVASDSLGANSEELNNLIQTDASINPGNSGGPLLDIKGNVIGVNVAVAEAENIGFAIPIDTVKDLISRLNSQGEIERPALGVRYVPVDESIQADYDLSVNYGALIERGRLRSEVAIIPNSPADKAGLRVGDVILEVNGNRIDANNTLQSEIQEYKVGDKVSLKILRDNQEINVEVTLEKVQ